MRDRLIEQIQDAVGGCARHWAEVIADRILADGWTRLPCKLGDTVWYISTENPHIAFQKELKPRTVKEPIEGILIAKDGVYINTYNFEEAKNYFDKVGEDYAYLSEEDAWAEIKRRERELVIDTIPKLARYVE